MRCHGNPFSRRGFLAAGTFGGLGISLPQLLWMQQAAAEQKHYDFIEAKAQSVIHVYLPGAWRIRKVGTRSPTARWSTAGR